MKTTPMEALLLMNAWRALRSILALDCTNRANSTNREAGAGQPAAHLQMNLRLLWDD